MTFHYSEFVVVVVFCFRSFVILICKKGRFNDEDKERGFGNKLPKILREKKSENWKSHDGTSALRKFK